MKFVGIDAGAREVNLVSVDLESMEASAHLLVGAEQAFETARLMTTMMPHHSWWDEIALVALERPAGKFKAEALVIGAILALIPNKIVVQTFVPTSWKGLIGLPLDAGAEKVQAWASEFGGGGFGGHACTALAICHAAIAYNKAGAT